MYSTIRDGTSINTFKQIILQFYFRLFYKFSVENEDPSILVIKDMNNYIFGVFNIAKLIKSK